MCANCGPPISKIMLTVDWAWPAGQMDKEDKEKAAQEPGGEAPAKPAPEPAKPAPDPVSELRWVGEPAAADAAKPAPAKEPELRWVGEPAAADATIDVTAEAVPEEAQATGPAAADAAGEKAESSEQAEVRVELWADFNLWLSIV